MESLNESKEKINQKNSKNYLEDINSMYILENVLDFLIKSRTYKIIKYNKKIQNRLNINLNTYKNYSESYSTIEIELIPTENKYTNIINLSEEYESDYHIYINDNKEEIKRKYIEPKDVAKKINIKIGHQVKSFKGLFSYCKYIESIHFKIFFRNNITDMSLMFSECKSLKEINFSSFNSDNVIDMSYMFSWCESLKELDLSNFNTSKVINMSNMFCGCSSLESINLDNFNTKNVNNMNMMFNKCLSLKDINISNFNFDNIKKINCIFGKCYSLKDLNLSNFCFDKKNIDMKNMFSECSIDLICKIKEKYHDFKD